MEQELGLIGGNIFHGELSVDQLFHMRPAPGYADYRTPIKGLYHGSSATHAGGGVNGIPGWRGLQDTTEVDVAAAIVEHLEGRVREGPVKDGRMRSGRVVA